MDYFDGLRIFAALCVIFMHTAAGPLRAGVNTDWHLLNVCTSLAFTAVPLFFMMSGYLLMTSRKTDRRMLKQRIQMRCLRKILILFIQRENL